MIAKIYPDNHPDLAGKRDPSHPVRYFDIRKLTEGECLRLMDVPESYFLKPDSVIKFFQANESDKNAAICYAYTDHKLSNEEIARIRKENGVG